MPCWPQRIFPSQPARPATCWATCCYSPHTDLTGTEIAVSYRFEGETADRNSTVNLSGGNAKQWDAGSQYAYTLTVSAASLAINVKVLDWDEQDTSVSWQ